MSESIPYAIEVGYVDGGLVVQYRAGDVGHAFYMPIDDAAELPRDLRGAVAERHPHAGTCYAIEPDADGDGVTWLFCAEIGADVYATPLTNAAALALADAAHRAVAERDAFQIDLGQLDLLPETPEPDRPER